MIQIFIISLLLGQHVDWTKANPQLAPAYVFVHVNSMDTVNIWFGDFHSTQTGPLRYFHTPPLSPGKTYTYQIRIRHNGYDTRHDLEVEADCTVHIYIPR